MKLVDAHFLILAGVSQIAAVHMTVSYQMSHSDPQKPGCQENSRGKEGVSSRRLGYDENDMIGCPAQAHCKNHPFQRPSKLAHYRSRDR